MACASWYWASPAIPSGAPPRAWPWSVLAILATRLTMSLSNSEPAADGLRLGIDVGGTNTDAAILDASDQVVASVKSPTTPDVTTGIVNALHVVLATSGVPPAAIRYAMLGTT